MASQITHQLSNFSSTKHKYFNCFSVFRNPPIRISHSISAGRPVGCYKLLQVNFALKVCALHWHFSMSGPHIGTFVMYFSLKWGKKIDKNVVKYRNRKGAKINMIQRLFLSMLPQKHLKIEKRTISNTEIRWTDCCSAAVFFTLFQLLFQSVVRVLIKWIANFIYFRMNFLPDTLTIGQLMKITFYIFKVLLKKQHLYQFLSI